MREKEWSDEYFLNETDGSIAFDNELYIQCLYYSVCIVKYREAETLLDGMPYEAILSGRSVVVSSIDPNLAKSISLGYIQTGMQRNIRFSKILEKEDGLKSLYGVVEYLFENGFEQLVTLKKEPVSRFSFLMPANMEPFKGWFSGDKLFLEELFSLNAIDADSYLYKENSAGNIEITENISSLDVLKLQRIFRFISYVYWGKINRIDNSRERILLSLRSVMPVFEKRELLMIVSIVCPENFEELLGLLTLNKNTKFVDLQYEPFIEIGSHYIFSPRIISDSDLVRNIIYKKNLRTKLVSDLDPMQESVANGLKKNGFLVETGVKGKISKIRYEIDILAYRDGFLFIFECKNSYLPATVHEIRTTYNHIRDAADQLNIRKNLFSNKENLEKLLKNIKWETQTVNDLYTGIITANRIFNGFCEQGHPVRQARELINVVRNGKINIRKGTEEKEILFWDEEKFTIYDLIKYLSGISIVNDQLSSLSERRRNFQFFNKSVEFNDYVIEK